MEDGNPEDAWKHRWLWRPPLRTSSLPLRLCPVGRSRSQGQDPRLRVGKPARRGPRGPQAGFHGHEQPAGGAPRPQLGGPRDRAPRLRVAFSSRPLCQRAAQGGLPRPCGRPPMGGFGCQPCDGNPVPRPARPAERRAPPCPDPAPIAVSSAPRAVVGALAGPRCGVLTQLLRRLLGLLCSRAGPAPRVTVAVSQVCVPCQGQPATGG